jgi:hypothetical protein
MEQNQPQVGVGVMIIKDGSVLLAKEKVPMVKASMPSLAGILSIWNHLNSARSARRWKNVASRLAMFASSLSRMCRPTRLDTTCMSVCWRIGTAVRQRYWSQRRQAPGNGMISATCRNPCSRCPGSRWRVARPVEITTISNLPAPRRPVGDSLGTGLPATHRRDTRPSLMGELA